MKNIKSNKFEVEKPTRRSGLAVAAMERGHKVMPDKKKVADKKACRGKVENE